MTNSFIKPNDLLGISYQLIFISLFSTFVFLISQAIILKPSNEKISITISAIVCLVASFHYYYMRNKYIVQKKNSIIYRYVDWVITVPLQLLEFYFLLKIFNANIGKEAIIKLLIPSVCMLVWGFIGESQIIKINRWICFLISIIFFLYIIFELFFGEVGNCINNLKKSIKKNFDILRYIIGISWMIYPIGYIFYKNQRTLNLIYNLADFVNKIAYVLVVFTLTQQDEKNN